MLFPSNQLVMNHVLIAIICWQFYGCILRNSRRGNSSERQNRISLEDLMSQDGLSAVVDAVELRVKRIKIAQTLLRSAKILLNKGRLELDEEVITKARRSVNLVCLEIQDLLLQFGPKVVASAQRQ